MVAVFQGEWKRASQLLAILTPMARQQRDSQAEVHALTTETFLALRSGRAAEVIPWLEQRIRSDPSQLDLTVRLGIECQMALAKFQVGHHEEAAALTDGLLVTVGRLHPASVMMFQIYSTLAEVALALLGEGRLHFAKGHPDFARSAYERARQAAKRLGMMSEEALALTGIGLSLPSGSDRERYLRRGEHLMSHVWSS